MASTSNKTLHLATIFKALGDPARLRIFDCLCSVSVSVMVGETGEVRPVAGITVGEVCCRITGEEKVSSTISQQLKQLRHAGLITMERRGKNMVCSVNAEALDLLTAYMEECKQGGTNDECCSS